jgi:hypothetical protein
VLDHGKAFLFNSGFPVAAIPSTLLEQFQTIAMALKKTI